jgi:hypothetical protein
MYTCLSVYTVQMMTWPLFDIQCILHHWFSYNIDIQWLITVICFIVGALYVHLSVSIYCPDDDIIILSMICKFSLWSSHSGLYLISSGKHSMLISNMRLYWHILCHFSKFSINLPLLIYFTTELDFSLNLTSQTFDASKLKIEFVYYIRTMMSMWF